MKHSVTTHELNITNCNQSNYGDPNDGAPGQMPVCPGGNPALLAVVLIGLIRLMQPQQQLYISLWGPGSSLSLNTENILPSFIFPRQHLQATHSESLIEHFKQHERNGNLEWGHTILTNTLNFVEDCK